MILRVWLLFPLIFFLSLPASAAKGTLSDPIRIESDALGYALQYRVYTPAGYDSLSDLPTIYVTDGPWYIRDGRLPKEIDRQIRKGAIKPIIAVFIDNRNPDNLRQNRRQLEFFCNQKYVNFFRQELVPTVSETYRVSNDRTDRVILGLSFGGLNSACFGLLAHDIFEGIAMQSPSTFPIPKLTDVYKDLPPRPIRVFLSTGNRNDSTADARALKRIFREKETPVLYREVPHGHNWDNWGPLQDDILKYFFKADGK